MSAYLFTQLFAGRESSDRPFLETPEGTVLSYRDAHKATARLARRLLQLGVRPGDRVAAQIDRSAEAIHLYLACLRVGGVYLPLNTAYTMPELEYFIGDAEPALVVCAPERRDAIRRFAGASVAVETLDASGRGTLMDGVAALPDHFVDVPRTRDDLAAILYTSGTTGRSKGAMLTHGNLASNAEALARCWRYTADDRLIHALPLFHTHGLFVAVNVTLAAGASLILVSRFDPDLVIALFGRATVLMGVPTFYTRLLQHAGLTREAVRGMRLFVSGSAPLTAETHDEWHRRTGHAILERYGMTETNMNTSNPYEGARKPGAVGRPLPGVEIRIADSQTGEPVPPGEPGEIEIRGPNVFKGYWRMPEKTAAEFRADGFFRSGDVGLVDADGYLHIVGRAKDLIITGGYNVYPREIEDEIEQIPGVAESAVVGLPDADFGEAVAAVVIRSAGSRLTASGVRAALENRLARYKHPKKIVFARSLPRNAMGKVQKNLIKEALASVHSSTQLALEEEQES
jgi:malonyl-CoA/methylmalonyl-CoA synthetase